MTGADFVIEHYAGRATGESAFALLASLYFDGVELPYRDLTFLALLRLPADTHIKPWCAMPTDTLIRFMLAHPDYAIDTARALAYINAHRS